MKNIYYLIVISCTVFSSLLNAQWIRNNGPNGGVHSFAVFDTNLFAGTVGGIIYRSTNNGTSWTAVFGGTGADAIAVSDTNIFAATDGGVYRSTNNGATWTVSGLTGVSPQALAITDTNLFAGTFQSGVYRSTNNGASWTAVNSGLTGTALYITALFAYETNLFAGTWGSSAYRSTNNGTTWTSASNGLTSNNVHAFTISPNLAGDTNLFAGTYFGNGVYLSTDNGTSWTAVNNGLTNNNVRALAVSDTNLFAGTDGGGVFHSTNNGTSWTAFNTGLTNNVINALLVSGTNLFAGTNDGVWRRPLSDITAVEDQSNEIPSQFTLEQNYPNPFNPTTTIGYVLQEKGSTKLTLMNTLGEEVAILVNEEQDKGFHKVDFNANNLPSGVYLYKLQAGNFTETKKLMLLK